MSSISSDDRFQIINFQNLVIATGGRGVACVFDVKFRGLTLCNLTLEHNRQGEFVLGYSRSPIRKRPLKGRQEMKVAFTPEMEKAIFEEANFRLGESNRKARRAGSVSSEYVSPIDGLTLPEAGEFGGDKR